MGKEEKIDIAQVMLTYLIKHYTTEQRFAATALYDVARRHGQSPKSAANNALRKLAAMGCVTRTDDVIENPRGGSDMPLYQRTGKDTLGPIKNKTAMHYDTIAEQHARMNNCQLNLQAILNNIARGGRNGVAA